ncbi:ribonuclease H-like domain-containing protein [Daldinia decipiens]|uniref:ribonuclease H-like domain-containing protein n=1 Tax=Daldinia decipiens TaxID=326647 RepID=UPI0020C54818|nr:ribonuclease H-like domain-containing protein [Daldinia decipiens]KAI1653557.1 ribonuclease H-like domain-containing protein [Daldinia decipiens]
MAQELSSNWKKLQGKIKAESTATSSSATKATVKRKADEGAPSKSQPKRQKLQNPSKQRREQRPLSNTSNKSSRKPTYTHPLKKPMGVAQSSAIAKGTPATITPSLALWAEDNDISPEDLAEAYNLGVKNNASLMAAEPARVNEGLAPGVDVGKYIALDCEMVGIGPEGRESVLARVSVVDFHGRQVYDSFVRPREPVTDWRTHITGLTPRILLPVARSFDEVQEAVAVLMRGRIIVGHDIRHDLAVLQLDHPSGQIRDTARFAGYRQYGHGPKPALRVLAREVLGVEIQTGHHSSIEDARVAMLLFRKRKSDFDVQHAGKYGLPTEKTIASEKVGVDGSKGQEAKSKKGTGKKKKKRH